MDPEQVPEVAREIVAALGPGLVAYRPTSLADAIGRSAAVRLFTLRLVVTFAAIGIGLGLLGALALSKLMTSLLFRVSPLDPLVLVGAVGFLAVVSGMAAYLPARQATAVDTRSALQAQ